MSKDEKQICAYCRFFCYDKRYEWGACRRRCPIVGLENGEWPSVKPADWCGQFEERMDE